MERKHFLGLGLVVFTPLALTAACGGSDSQPPAGSGGETASGGGPSMGGENMGGTPEGSGSSASSGGKQGSGGKPGSGGQGPSSGGGENLGGMGGMEPEGPVVVVPDFDGETPCESDKECTIDGKLCDKELRVCVSCFETADCGDAEVCDAGTCREIVTCDNSLACSTDEVCVKEESAEEGVCKECGADADCTEGGTCILGTCLDPCESDKECTPDGLLCNGELGACTECVASSDCKGSESCEGGQCQSATCRPSESQCLDNAIITCREDGRGYMDPIDCGEATCGLLDDSETVSCVSKENPGNGGTNIVWEDFSGGAGRWSISAADPSGPPEIRDGAACMTQGSFTLGWPSDGVGFDLKPGSYTFSFIARTADAAGVEAKIAAADEPWEPVYFADQDFDVAEKSHQSFSFTIDEERAENIGIAFNVWNNESTICFDEISLSMD